MTLDTGRMDEDRLHTLRRALHSGDPATMVAAVADHGFTPSVQLVGDLLLLALRSDAAGARDLAAQCVAALEARRWDGDLELADALRGDTSPGADGATLIDLPIDLDELSGILEGDPMHGGGRVDLRTGEVWPQSTFDDGVLEEDEASDLEDPERWLTVWSHGSRDGYRDMVSFADSRTDPRLVDLLDAALAGRGAFRRFRDVLLDFPHERAEWLAVSDDRQRGRARAWLADAGFRAIFRRLGG